MTLPRKPYTAEIETLLAAATRRRYAAKSRIVNKGETPTEMFFILQGSVMVLMEDLDGHDLILSYLGPGEFFGELGFFGVSAKRSAYVRARTECEIATIGYDRLKRSIRAQPELLLQFTMQIAERLRVTSEKLGHLAFLDVTGRIARALLDLARDSQAAAHPDGALVRMTREELGRVVNCSPKMVSRVLRNLEEQGLIQVHGKSIVVMGLAPQPPGLNESPDTENSLKTGTGSGK
jgi:CRP/FNR family transcriptional regulator, cyclic AMP receptor protein